MNKLLFNNKYRIPSARLSGWDYRTSAPYFVTICSKNRQNIFGEIHNNELLLNDLGKFASECIENISIYSQCAIVINQIVMPNHVQILLELENNTRDYQPNTFGPLLEKSLSSVINHFKGRVTRFANENHFSSGWQERFHEHIVKDTIEYQRIFEYISNNPINWVTDIHFT